MCFLSGCARSAESDPRENPNNSKHCELSCCAAAFSSKRGNYMDFVPLESKIGLILLLLVSF